MSRTSRSSTPTRSTLGSFLLGCATGVVIGAALGVLTAPHRGKVTRTKLARKAEEAREQILETVENAVESAEDEAVAKKPATEEGQAG